MKPGKWRVARKDFRVRVQKAHAMGEIRDVVTFNEEPYKAVFQNEYGSNVLSLSVFCNSDLVQPPGIFNIEYRTKTYYFLQSFADPKDVEEWFDKKHIKYRPDVQEIYKKMITFNERILKATKRLGFGIEESNQEWLDSLK
jgi:hypothetical protein